MNALRSAATSPTNQPPQVCTDYLSKCDVAMARASLRLVDRQLAAAPLSSQEGQDYLAAMAAAANFAFANRCVCYASGRDVDQATLALELLELGFVRWLISSVSSRFVTSPPHLFSPSPPHTQQVHHGPPSEVSLQQGVQDSCSQAGTAAGLRRQPQHRQAGGAHAARWHADEGAVHRCGGGGSVGSWQGTLFAVLVVCHPHMTLLQVSA